ncbi:MAG: nuclear transport factor 2 family protein [Candidatus Latescibacteria bacterium]|nr:nuclear transport factor 2 family protein [Candidatus Latescibacterota bacterium]
MKKVLPVLVVCILVLAFGCDHSTHAPGSAASKQVDYEAIKAQLQKEQQEYAQAWCNKDMNAISRIWSHDDDITIWGPAERTRIQGWEGPNGVKAFYQSGFDGAKSIDFKISDVLVKVSKTGTAAVVTYYIENDMILNDGSKVKMTPRVTVVRELVDGVWKTIHGDASFSIAEFNAMK